MRFHRVAEVIGKVMADRTATTPRRLTFRRSAWPRRWVAFVLGDNDHVLLDKRDGEGWAPMAIHLRDMAASDWTILAGDQGE